MPFMQRATNGCCSNFTPSYKTSIEESAESAVFIALYPSLICTVRREIRCHSLFQVETHQCFCLYSTGSICSGKFGIAWRCPPPMNTSFAAGDAAYLFSPSLTRDIRGGSICARLNEFPWDGLAAEVGLSWLLDTLVFGRVAGELSGTRLGWANQAVQ